MSAFVTFLKAYAVWIYLVLIFGILFGIKMLMDAQRLSRTTLFSLDQERATEQTYRGLILIVVFLVIMFAVTGLVLFVGPLAPPPDSAILRLPTATLPAIIFPTSTPTATPTTTPPPATETPFFTTTPTIIAPTRTFTRTINLLPTATPTSLYPFPAPKIVGPLPNGGVWSGEGQASAAITLRWECEKCFLGPSDWYEIVISYQDKNNVLRTVAGRTRDNFIPLRRIYEGGGFELYHQSREDVYNWFVQIKREPGNQPISPPSEIWKFIWH